jgi:heme-degrading monooxygenase HmoA
MVRATLTMKVQEGREADFEAAWRAVAEQTRSAPGNISQTLLRASDAERTFIIVSDWESREHFGQFERSPEQDDLTAPIRALRESASMRVDEIVAHVQAG